MYGDTEQDTVKAILTELGGTPAYGDSQRELWRKMVVAAGGEPQYGDAVNKLMGRYLEARGGVDPGGTEKNRLQAILENEGGTPDADDGAGDLLSKILAQGVGIPPVLMEDSPSLLLFGEEGLSASAWEDQSGNGNNAAFASPGTLVSGPNGKSAYDPATFSSIPTTPFDTQAFTLFLVVRSENGNQVVNNVWFNGLLNLMFAQKNQGSPTIYPTTSPTTSEFNIDEQWTLFVFQGSASQTSIRKNGVANINSGAAIGAASGSGVILFGLGTGGYNFGGKCAMAALYPSAMTLPKVEEKEAAIFQYYGIPSVVPTSAILVAAEGDSITTGYCADIDCRSYTYGAVESMATPGVLRNFAVSSSTFINLNARAPWVDSLYSSSRAKNILIVFAGTNEAGGSVTYDNLVNYCNARKAVGWKIIVLSMLPRLPDGGEANRATFNGLLRAAFNAPISSLVFGKAAGTTFADYMVDIGAHPVLGVSPASGTYYPDGIHPNQAGHNIIQPYVTAALNAASA